MDRFERGGGGRNGRGRFKGGSVNSFEATLFQVPLPIDQRRQNTRYLPLGFRKTKREMKVISYEDNASYYCPHKEKSCIVFDGPLRAPVVRNTIK